MTSLTIEPMSVPLHVDDTGTIRAGGTRLLLDLVVHQYQQGASPEEIVSAFPIVKVSDVYAVIAYYLEHQPELDAYLAERKRKGREWRAYWETQIPDHVRERIRAYRARQAGKVS